MTAAAVFLGLALAIAALHVAAHLWTAQDFNRHCDEAIALAGDA